MSDQPVPRWHRSGRQAPGPPAPVRINMAKEWRNMGLLMAGLTLLPMTGTAGTALGLVSSSRDPGVWETTSPALRGAAVVFCLGFAFVFFNGAAMFIRAHRSGVLIADSEGIHLLRRRRASLLPWPQIAALGIVRERPEPRTRAWRLEIFTAILEPEGRATFADLVTGEGPRPDLPASRYLVRIPGFGNTADAIQFAINTYRPHLMID